MEISSLSLTPSALLLPLERLRYVVHRFEIRSHDENHILGIDSGKRIRPQGIRLFVNILLRECGQLYHETHLAGCEQVVPDDDLERRDLLSEVP